MIRSRVSSFEDPIMTTKLDCWPEKKSVVLICGASANGKSYFLEKLIADELDSTIVNSLPAGLAEWPILEANDFLKQIHRPKRENKLLFHANASNVIAHYDSHFIRNFEIVNYEDDPAHKLWATSHEFLVVNILPDLEVLRSQYKDREFRKISSKPMVSNLWSRFVKQNIKRITRTRNFTTGSELLKNSELFFQLENRWLHYLERLSKLDNCVSVIYLKRDDFAQSGFAIVNVEDD